MIQTKQSNLAQWLLTLKYLSCVSYTTSARSEDCLSQLNLITTRLLKMTNDTYVDFRDFSDVVKSIHGKFVE